VLRRAVPGFPSFQQHRQCSTPMSLFPDKVCVRHGERCDFPIRATFKSPVFSWCRKDTVHILYTSRRIVRIMLVILVLLSVTYWNDIPCCSSTPSLATISFNGLADQPEISHLWPLTKPRRANEWRR